DSIVLVAPPKRGGPKPAPHPWHFRAGGGATASLADAAVGAAAQDNPRRRAGMGRILDDDDAIDDDRRARTARIAVWVRVSRLVPEIIGIKDRKVGAVAPL